MVLICQHPNTTLAVLKQQQKNGENEIAAANDVFYHLPKSTLLISKKGAHTVKPLPIKSIAALRSGMCAGSFGEGGANNKWDNAIEVSLAKLLLPIPERKTYNNNIFIH